MKKVILISIILLELNYIFAQVDTIKKGAYLTFFDFRKNSPTSQDSFKITLRQLNYDFDLYKFKSVNKTIKRNILKKYTWGIYDGHNLYINCYKITFKRGYSIAEEIGRFIYFKAPPYMNLAQERKIANATMYYGVAGGVISAGQVYGEIGDKVNYIIDTEIGIPNLLDRAYMIKILEPYPDLLEQYKKEINQDDLATLLKYIRIINAIKK